VRLATSHCHTRVDAMPLGWDRCKHRR
jgi:hypothetical protein